MRLRSASAVRPAVREAVIPNTTKAAGDNVFILDLEADAASITPLIVRSGGPLPEWEVRESGGASYYYSTDSFTHNRVVSGPMRLRLLNTEDVAPNVTTMNLNGDGLSGNVWGDLKLDKFTAIRYLYLYNNSLTGDFSHWNVPSDMKELFLFNNSFTGDLSNWVIPSGFVKLNIRTNSFSGDLSSWAIPSGMTEMYIYTNNFTGDLSGTDIPASMTQFQASNNDFTGGPRVQVGSSAIINYLMLNCLMNQAAVDQVCQDLYSNRNNFSYATPELNVGGTNSAPSGVYQDGDPPTTGKEYIYEIVNDPETEGFNTWTVTYTA